MTRLSRMISGRVPKIVITFMRSPPFDERVWLLRVEVVTRPEDCHQSFGTGVDDVVRDQGRHVDHHWLFATYAVGLRLVREEAAERDCGGSLDDDEALDLVNMEVVTSQDAGHRR